MADGNGALADLTDAELQERYVPDGCVCMWLLVEDDESERVLHTPKPECPVHGTQA